ncbi:Angiotensin-converting enzyme [Gryllus bimaculatus]|nr:Angiotensin-converting enzyme [Gryllus bimaculatus]
MGSGDELDNGDKWETKGHNGTEEQHNIDLVELLTHSRDANELRHAWVEWRRSSGEKCRGLFERYVALSNEAAALNNFTDMSEMWLEPYEAKDFRDQVRELWEQLRPLYEQLHAYVRRKLQEQYGEAEVSRDGPIPAHLLGNMWSQSWAALVNETRPAPNTPPADVTPEMVHQVLCPWPPALRDCRLRPPRATALRDCLLRPPRANGYTPLRIFKLAEEFFISLNMSAMPDLFWERSILEKPADREITIKQCTRVDMEHMFTAHHEMGHIQYFLQYKHQPVVYREGANPAKEELRCDLVKQCTRPDMKHLLTAHHEMGHVQYFLQYKHQPVAYRRGANPGFHEAVGDVMSLSVSTPKHLRQVGLLRDEGPRDDDASALNYLFLQALQKVAFLPYAYLMDLWRWDVFNGSVTSDEYNCRWWRLREQYQGIEPPVDRTEEDFDPGAKYHIVASVPYIRYFVSYVIQFQFHRALCLEAGQFDPNDPMKPLYACDIYGSTAAGNKLKAMLQLGSSRPWPEALEAVTGSRRMDASGLLDYFKPLYEWLKAENARTGERVGWGPSRRACVSTRDELERLRRPDDKMDANKMEADKMDAEKMGDVVPAAPEAVPEVAAAAAVVPEAAAVVPEAAAAPAADAPVPVPAPAAVAAPSDSAADEVVPAAEAPVDRR